MIDPHGREVTPLATLTAAPGAAVVSAPCPLDALGPYLGREHYSYSFVLERFRPLLDRWGAWSERPRPESQADFALRKHRRHGRAAFHLAFAPPHRLYLCRKAVNAGFVFWEFPDVPALDYDYNPRNNWARIAGRLDRLLTACTFTRDAFRRVGVSAVDVVPVPIPPPHFDLPDWRPGQVVRLDATCYVLPMADDPVLHANPWLDSAPAVRAGQSLQGRMRAFYRANVRPYLPAGVVRGVQLGYRAALRAMGQPNEIMQIPIPPTQGIDLGGVVYLSFINPFDPRKNWTDLISAFLRALGDRDDATLVVKLVMPSELTAHGFSGIFGFYRELGLRHRCKLVVLPHHLDDAQMQHLTRAATYYVSATRAEGANLPLMDALAAGRPGVVPLHSAMLDYFSPDAGWVVSSSPEPAPFPFSSGFASTTWARIDWQSLHDRFRESYDAARTARYRALSRWGRERMREYASHEAVWPRFSAALDALAELAQERS